MIKYDVNNKYSRSGSCQYSIPLWVNIRRANNGLCALNVSRIESNWVNTLTLHESPGDSKLESVEMTTCDPRWQIWTWFWWGDTTQHLSRHRVQFTLLLHHGCSLASSRLPCFFFFFLNGRKKIFTRFWMVLMTSVNFILFHHYMMPPSSSKRKVIGWVQLKKLLNYICLCAFGLTLT